MKEETINITEILPILLSSILGLLYAFFFMGKDPVLLIIFGLQTFRSGSALRSSMQHDFEG